MNKKPNVVYVFGDQHRADAAGYAGNKDVISPFLDKMSAESISFENAVSVTPICTPYRGCLMTGQYPTTHGNFVNDVCLSNNAVSIAQAFKKDGYDTAYIGKWHLDGHGRSSYIPKERRQGFEFWQVLECNHHYNESYYYDNDNREKQLWDGYDAIGQTKSAQNYIKSHKKDKPFFLVLSWGPPHDPYATAPQKYRDMYQPEDISLRPNALDNYFHLAVPPHGSYNMEKRDTRTDLANYYSHITALDDCLKELDQTIKEAGIAEDTIFIYTSDHGDMIGSHGQSKKYRPYDESIKVPFLLRYPELFGKSQRKIKTPINAPDIMPTLLGLCDIEIPETVEGNNYAPFLKGEEQLKIEGALLQVMHPSAEWTRFHGGKEYRGIRTERYTYVRDLFGPWLLFDNENDPYQLINLLFEDKNLSVQKELNEQLNKLLKERSDKFLPGDEYIKKWGYTVDSSGTVPFTL